MLRIEESVPEGLVSHLLCRYEEEIHEIIYLCGQFDIVMDDEADSRHFNVRERLGDRFLILEKDGFAGFTVAKIN